ncbi:MAG TPA: DMT family transporter [Vitreimonas sp.]|nr:DMT family transporter [Vitreimonas sp.]
MWFVLGLFSAFFDASRNVLAKHNTKSFNSLVVTWAWVFYSLIILVPVMFVHGIPQLDAVFWLAFSARIVLDFISLLLYVEALRRSDLSLTLPMLSFTPLVLLVSGLIINQEFPSQLGLAGVILIVLGMYILHFKRQEPLWQPLLCMTRDTGTFCMFGAAVLWGITGSLHKLAIAHSNPYFYTGLGAVVLAAVFTPLAFGADRQQFKQSLTSRYMKQLLPVGILDGLSVLSQMVGQSLSVAVLLISVKRTSIIFSSVMGWYFFQENIKHRLVPICMMVAGVILIAVS